jgi:hypothetical protein
MTDIKIVNKNVGYMAKWHTENPDLIYLNVYSIWHWSANNSPPRATQDEMEDRFAMKLGSVFLQELVCIFKTADKIRLKGGSCNPICRHEKLVDLMSHPDDWEDVREHHRKKKIRVLEES